MVSWSRAAGGSENQRLADLVGEASQCVDVGAAICRGEPDGPPGDALFGQALQVGLVGPGTHRPADVEWLGSSHVGGVGPGVGDAWAQAVEVGDLSRFGGPCDA